MCWVPYEVEKKCLNVEELIKKLSELRHESNNLREEKEIVFNELSTRIQTAIIVTVPDEDIIRPALLKMQECNKSWFEYSFMVIALIFIDKFFKLWIQ